MSYFSNLAVEVKEEVEQVIPEETDYSSEEAYADYRNQEIINLQHQ